MVIVAGHITVDPEQRESYLAGCMSVVEKARRADGCLDFVIRSAPGTNKARATRSVSVGVYDIADVRPLFGEGRA